MTIISEVKEIAALVKKVGDADLYRRIVELQGEVIELSAENYELKKTADELRRKADLKEAMHFRNGYYFRENDNQPHCAHCFEHDGIAIHLVAAKSMRATWECPHCKFEYRGHAPPAPPPAAAIT